MHGLKNKSFCEKFFIFSTFKYILFFIYIWFWFSTYSFIKYEFINLTFEIDNYFSDKNDCIYNSFKVPFSLSFTPIAWLARNEKRLSDFLMQQPTLLFFRLLGGIHNRHQHFIPIFRHPLPHVDSFFLYPFMIIEDFFTPPPPSNCWHLLWMTSYFWSFLEQTKRYKWNCCLSFCQNNAHPLINLENAFYKVCTVCSKPLWSQV